MFSRLCIFLVWVVPEARCIINGVVIHINESAFSVSIIDNLNLVGTGAILTYQSVLTTVIHKKPDSYWVRIGHDGFLNKEGHNISVSRVIRHPDHVHIEFHLMIIILKENFEKMDGIFKPVPLPEKDVNPKTVYAITSYGPMGTIAPYGQLNSVWMTPGGKCDEYFYFNSSIHTCFDLTGYDGERGNPMADNQTLYGISMKLDKSGATFFRIFPFIQWIVDNQDPTTESTSTSTSAITTTTTTKTNTTSPTDTTRAEDRYVDHAFENRPNPLCLILIPIILFKGFIGL